MAPPDGIMETVSFVATTVNSHLKEAQDPAL